MGGLDSSQEEVVDFTQCISKYALNKVDSQGVSIHGGMEE